MCNVFSALGVGLLQKNVFTLFGGVAFSLTMFGLSVFVVEEALATFFATLVAVYWLVIGWTIGSFLAALLNLNPLLPPVFTSIVFFGTSLCLNVWYTSRKNL